MRAQNSSLLVQLIWTEQRISRVEISRRTGLAPSTVSLIVGALSEAGLVREVGTQTSARGRRPTLLTFNDDVYNILGLELGIRHVAVALTDLRGRVRAFRTERSELRLGPKGTLDKARELIGECLKEGRVSKKKVLGIGVGVPSPINQYQPGLLSKRLYPSWADYDVKKDLEKSLRLPVFIDNDANLGALAEQWWGAGVGKEDLVYVKLGAGIGAGHVLGGELYRGAAGTAGEIGHICVDPRGPECSCGGRGCLTKFISSDTLIPRAQQLFKDKHAGIHSITDRARSGDPKALELLKEVAEYLGQVIVGSLINLMAPSVIVLGGEICSAGNLLLDPLREFVSRRLLTDAFDAKSVVLSGLGQQSVAIGAATLYLDEALRQPERFLLPKEQD
jgi:predicted NBD/HSP70 family sugar kinase